MLKKYCGFCGLKRAVVNAPGFGTPSSKPGEPEKNDVKTKLVNLVGVGTNTYLILKRGRPCVLVGDDDFKRLKKKDLKHILKGLGRLVILKDITDIRLLLKPLGKIQTITRYLRIRDQIAKTHKMSSIEVLLLVPVRSEKVKQNTNAINIYLKNQDIPTSSLRPRVVPTKDKEPLKVVKKNEREIDDKEIIYVIPYMISLRNREAETENLAETENKPNPFLKIKPKVNVEYNLDGKRLLPKSAEWDFEE